MCECLRFLGCRVHTSLLFVIDRCGSWLARGAHNPKVGSSNLPPSTIKTLNWEFLGGYLGVKAGSI